MAVGRRHQGQGRVGGSASVATRPPAHCADSTGCAAVRQFSAIATESPSAVAMPSHRGNAIADCLPLAVRPRPGGRSDRSRARLRSISDSAGSPSRSSIRVAIWSLTAGRSSAQRDAVTTTCTPNERPWAAIAVIGASRLSNSWRSAAQPSMTRNTSPKRILGGSRLSGCSSPAIVGDRIDPESAEQRLPPPYHRFDHRDGAAAQIDVLPPRHRAHMGQLPQRGQPAAAEVEAVEPQIRRIMVFPPVPAASCATLSTSLTVAHRRARHFLRTV